MASIATAPTPGRESAPASLLLEAEHVNRTAPEWCHGLVKNVFDYVVGLQTEFLWHTILFQLKWQVLHI